MMRLTRITGVLTAALIGVSLASAQPSTWTVDSEPTLATAIAQARPGDSIVVKNGVYDFPVRIVAANGAVNGTAAAPITLKAESIGGVVFTGGTLSDRVKMRIERDYWHIDGFTFDDITTLGATSTDRVTAVRIRSANHNVLSNLTISNVGFTAANPDVNASNNSMFLNITANSSNNVVERSQFLNNRKVIVARVGGGATDTGSTDNVFRYNYWSGNAGFETLQLSWGSTNGVPYRTIVEHNLWQDNLSSSELISAKSDENVFRYNTFDHNNDQLVLRSSNGSVVESNYFLDGRGIRAYGGDHTITNNYMEGTYGPASGNLRGGFVLGAGVAGDAPYVPFHESVLSNNTVINTGTDTLLYGQFYNSTVSGAYINVAPYGNLFEDNLLVNNAGQAIRIENGAPDTNDWTGNVVWSTPGGSAGYTPNGVTTGQDPGLVRDALGNLVPTTMNGVGASMPVRRLTIDDVGPGSTFVALLAGDYNFDGLIDAADYLVWRDAYGGNDYRADGNRDGVIDSADYTIWRDAMSMAAVTAVPEPATSLVLAMGMTVVWMTYRHASGRI